MEWKDFLAFYQEFLKSKKISSQLGKQDPEEEMLAASHTPYFKEDAHDQTDVHSMKNLISSYEIHLRPQYAEYGKWLNQYCENFSVAKALHCLVCVGHLFHTLSH